jgi:hypothetical protein
MADQSRCGVDVVDRQSLGCPRLLAKGKFLAFRYTRNGNDLALFSISYHWGRAGLVAWRFEPNGRCDLLDAIARDRLGETQAGESDVERALELAEPDGLIWPLLVTPARDLLEHHPRHRSAHGGLLRGILDVLAGSPPARAGEPTALRDDVCSGEQSIRSVGNLTNLST